MAFEIDSDSHFVEKVHAENAVDFAAAGVADRAEIDGWKF